MRHSFWSSLSILYARFNLVNLPLVVILFLTGVSIASPLVPLDQIRLLKPVVATSTWSGLQIESPSSATSPELDSSGKFSVSHLKSGIHHGISQFATPTWKLPPRPTSTASSVPPGVEPEDDENPSAAGDWGYLNLVNGSPYNFVVTHNESELMTERWKWVTVPPGQGYQSYISLADTSSRGEVFYKIDGTRHSFKLFFDRKNGFNVTVSLDEGLLGHSKCQTTSLSKHFQRDRSTNLVITGTEDLGYWSSTDLSPDWMQQLFKVIGGRKLRHICMPGSHDAGVSLLKAKTPFASRENTQTQISDIYGQLRLGSRYFDIRPVLANGGQFYTGHFGNILGIGNFQGGIGQSMDDIIENVNRFLSEYNELIILNLSHSLDAENGYRVFSQFQWSTLFQKLQSLNHRFNSTRIIWPTDDLTSMRLNEFITATEGRVLIIASDAPNALPREGIFPAVNFPLIDSYANTPKERQMASDQIQKLHQARVITDDNALRKDHFFIFSWTLTSNFESILKGKSIAHLALDLAYDSIFWRAYNSFTPESFPNVLYMDFFGTADWAPAVPGVSQWPSTPPNGTYTDVMLLAMAVNLQIASQNPYVISA
ncbi:PLC-like phosphodiesterase [Tothia fuscella]|uniref:PLC-like phosphodiesterase n=1 Tax=Tothia fuscella TaxID=1048955 RepID=A0A9P4TUI4_9PEZI|nr:PLC-like phosphodiesterase [Tothia fuscella]